MPDPKPTPRQCLYKGSDSQIFEGEEAIEAAVDDGWVDHPDKTDPNYEPEPDTSTANDGLKASLEDAAARIRELEEYVEKLAEANKGLTAANADLKSENGKQAAEISKLQQDGKKPAKK